MTSSWYERATFSRATGGGYPAMRTSVCDVLTRLTLERASTRMGERGRAAHGVSGGRKR